MPHPELAAYIQEQTQQGVSAFALREALMESGWREIDIENALHDVAAGLAPLTMGASIHEDLAQVRGMVAHLAGRMRSMEAQLRTTGLLPMQEELTGGTLAPEHTLSAPQIRWGRCGMWLVGIAILLCGGGLFLARLIGQEALSTSSGLLIATGCAIGMAIAGSIAIHRRTLEAAVVWWAAAIGVSACTIGIAWRVTHTLEWTTALAFAVFLIVLTGVVGRRLPHAG